MPSVLDLTLGALEIGTLIATALYGVTTVQVYIYSQGKIKDPLWVRIMVGTLWVFESAHTLFVWLYLYRVTVTFYGQPSALLSSHWTFNVGALFDGLVGAIVQCYFAYRVFVLSGRWYIAALAWVGSLLQFALALATMILAQTETIAAFHEKTGWIITAYCCVNAIVDFINTTALCWHLWGERAGIRSTDRTLDKLIMWSIETGLLTMIAAILMLVLSLTEPTTYLWIAISFFYAKLYSNSLLASLNGRESLRRGVQGVVHTSSTGSHSHHTRLPSAPFQVSITTEREVEMAPRNRESDMKKEPMYGTNFLQIDTLKGHYGP